jgi:hypothetical protein
VIFRRKCARGVPRNRTTKRQWVFLREKARAKLLYASMQSKKM